MPTEELIERPEALSACCAYLKTCPVIGFDTEFIGEQTFHPQLCLVQVATPERVYIIDPLELEDLTPFWELVADPKRVAVVHAGREDFLAQFSSLVSFMSAAEIDRPGDSGTFERCKLDKTIAPRN